MAEPAPQCTMRGSGLGQLLLRGALGGTMIAHGLRHARTQEGTAAWFGSIGFRQPRLQAQLSAAVEIGAGAAVASGAATPWGSAVRQFSLRPAGGRRGRRPRNQWRNRQETNDRRVLP